ncbi:WD repeat-containing protein 86 isoform X2 [Chrysemys picta bellii]|uniref:WD repeat-containing protein 86 isoform X2 n=1 Tax=Chrysemys picta bellii TaxID=8478 RepID=UPI0032B0FF36
MGSSGSALKVCTDHRGGINWLSLSPDGQHLLTGSEDGTARLWSTADSQCHGHFQGHESYITFCHLENEVAFTCSADHTIRKWDVMTGQCLAIYRGHTSIVNRILVAKDYLFSSSYDRTARCWSVDKEKQIQEFRGHRNCVLTLAHYSSRDVLDESEEEQEKLSRDFLVTGSTDCTVKVWWVSSGRCYQTLLGHTGAVLCLILDAPNRELFSGSTDYTIRTWNIVTGEQLKVFKEHQGSVICLELVNRYLYSGSADKTVKCWLADTGEQVQTYKTHKHSVSTLKYHAGILAPRGPVEIRASLRSALNTYIVRDDACSRELTAEKRQARQSIFADGEQRQETICPRSHRKSTAELGLEPMSPDCQASILTTLPSIFSLPL